MQGAFCQMANQLDNEKVSNCKVWRSLVFIIRARCGVDSDWDGEQPMQQFAMLEQVAQ
jgi:hypothetical protein